MSALSPRDQFLDAYEREHTKTMKVLRAFPEDRLGLRPHPKCRTAKELAWVFWAERLLGQAVYNNKFLEMDPASGPPPPPDSWSEQLEAIETAHRELADLVRRASDEELTKTVKFFTAPKTVGDIPRIDFLWFLLFDEIHHRGQFSIYLRMADAKVPAIYGPSGDEPFM